MKLEKNCVQGQCANNTTGCPKNYCMLKLGHTYLAQYEADCATQANQQGKEAEPLKWRFTGIAGLKRYMTESQYQAQTPATQKWYEPICEQCATRAADPAPARPDAIARSKRILALVDDYHENPTTDTRTALRIALMDEFEADPAQAEPSDERQRFETWAVMEMHLDVARNSDGSLYKVYETQTSWRGWQARAAIQGAPNLNRIADYLAYEQAAMFKDKTKFVEGYRQACSDCAEYVRSASQGAQLSPVPMAWPELCRRLYVELFHCDQQMTAAWDEDGEPLFVTGKSVSDVLHDAKSALELYAASQPSSGITAE